MKSFNNHFAVFNLCNDRQAFPRNTDSVLLRLFAHLTLPQVPESLD